MRGASQILVNRFSYGDSEKSLPRDPALLSADGDPAIDRIWREFKITGSPALRNILIIHYMSGHVRRIAQRLHSQLPKQVDVDDLVDEAYEGLVHVIDHFDIDRDIRFETFSSHRICGAMRDYLRKINWKPRLEQTRGRLLHAAIEKFQKIHGCSPDTAQLREIVVQIAVAKFRRKHGRGPDAEESRELLKLSEKSFRKFLAAGRPSSMVSFNSGSAGLDVHGRGEHDSDAMAGFEDRRRPSPFTGAELADLRRWVIQGFARRDRLIIVLYYYEQLTMKEIGRTLGCSESRVSQRLDSILGCLRARLSRTGTEQEFYGK